MLVGAMGMFAVAPFQCPSKPDPTRVREDTPGEALYDLAGQFGKAGDKEGKVRTLRYLCGKYPRSRFAARARDDLKDLGVVLPEPSVGPDLEREGVPFGRLPSDQPSASAAVSSAPPSSAAPTASSSEK